MGAGHNHGAPTTEAGAPGDHRARLWIAFGLTATIVIAQAEFAPPTLWIRIAESVEVPARARGPLSRHDSPEVRSQAL